MHYNFVKATNRPYLEELKNKTHDQLNIISKNFSFYTSFRNSLKKINKEKLINVQ